MWDQYSSINTKKVAAAMIILVITTIFTLVFSPHTFPFDSRYRLGRYEAEPHFSSSRFRIAIIGSAGYIGSRLMNHLPEEKNWTVIGYDRIFPGQASYEISMKDLQSFQVVIYLGGLTGRAMCRDYPNGVDRENIDDIHRLAKRMLPFQLLIFASTSAIAEGSGSVPVDEDFPVQSSLLDSYASSLFRREQTLRHLASTFTAAPRMIGLRFGTVVGLSPSQRTDLSPMAFVCQAFLTGRLHVTHPESNRAFLSMEDLMRAVTVMIKRFKHAKRFDIFHLQSLSVSISKLANCIARLTGAHIDALDHAVHQDSHGFSLNNTKFRNTFDFTFEDDLDKLLSILIANVPQMCPGRESRLDNDSIPCVVCGSRDMHTVLDLHQQPLANHFETNRKDAIQSKRFPLRLVRCPVCHHTQLSYIVDRKYFSSQHSYQNGARESLQTDAVWLVRKTMNESTIINGTVLEIACNDGTQLDEFLKRGWKTVGVDVAKNLADIARRHGHIVHTGFWGIDEFPSLSPLGSLDVIIAKNVLAYVDNPIRFVRACAAMMSITTKLYIQTSQCDMYETGQFDTVYHEHVSFFTAHSFRKLAEQVGLTITNFEIVPMYGRSCLVTFQRMESANISTSTSPTELVPSLSLALEKERNLEMHTSWFYI